MLEIFWRSLLLPTAAQANDVKYVFPDKFRR